MGLCRWMSHLNQAPASLLGFGDRVRYRQYLSRRQWKKRSWLAFGTFALLASAKTAVAEQSSDTLLRMGSGNPVAGKQKSESERCQECHGETGNAEDARIPKHAGQYAGYLVKQLRNFQSGERRHDIMMKMAADLSPADIEDIAAYFASQKTMQGDGSGNNKPVAKNLFLNGDRTRDIPSCVSCHGENGKGKVADNVIYPVIGGQNKMYLRRQLVNWKLGERKNSPDAVMNQVSKSLNEDEIEALVDYISGL
ncbi:c-type cytochrome [Methylomonas sp. 2BW1-5-20]|uniref:c-type cytochrome n=1 Tax=Methylomonas sp. 2BW1-5-20 TaxID=3376686 RepID=UPI00404E176C